MTAVFQPAIRHGVLILGLVASGFIHAQGVERPAVQVGDRWKYETKDGLTNLVTHQTERIITSVGNERIEATENGSPATFTPDMNPIENPESRFDPPARIVQFPFAVGDKWRHEGKTTNKASGGQGHGQYEVTVAGQEKISVAAGSFDTYKLVMEGYFTARNAMGGGGGMAFTRTYWYAPAIRGYAKIENNSQRIKWTMELIEVGVKP